VLIAFPPEGCRFGTWLPAARIPARRRFPQNICVAS
jgi:hypothetical protein